MLEQTRRAVHEADLVFFLVDGRQGVTPIDSHFARWLRRENPAAPVHLVANKIEGDADRFEDSLNDCFRLGMGAPIPLSAEHGEGTTDLLDLLIPAYDAFEKEQDEVQQQWEEDHREEEVESEDPEDEDEDEDVRDFFLLLSVVDNGTDIALMPQSRIVKLAIVGRPNVGKSTLLNKIVRKERVLTGPE